MEWITNLLQHYPELAIFITLALGFWIGKFKNKEVHAGNGYQAVFIGRCIDRAIKNRYKRTVKVRLFLDVPLRCRI